MEINKATVLTRAQAKELVLEYFIITCGFAPKESDIIVTVSGNHVEVVHKITGAQYLFTSEVSLRGWLTSCDTNMTAMTE